MTQMYGTLHSAFRKRGLPANNEQWRMFQQKFSSEVILMNDSNNNEQLFINLATVPCNIMKTLFYILTILLP
jgi:hypothetical protein